MTTPDKTPRAARPAGPNRGEGIVAEHDCPTCICGRRAPVQGEQRRAAAPVCPEGKAAGTVSWAEHEEAYADYARRYGTSQSAQVLASRGGFGYREITTFLGHEPTTWQPRGAR